MKTFVLCILLALPALPAMAVEPYLVKDVEPATTTDGSRPADLVTLRGAILFFADDGVSGRQLWRTDGTAAGTYTLSDFPEGDHQVPFLATERLYFFLSSQAGDWGLWVSDGTPAGTLRLTGEDVTASNQGLFAAGQGLLYFMASDPEHGRELWRSDGTPAGTRIVADASPGPEDSDIQELTQLRGFIWFNMRGNSIWRTDGTAAGTALAIDPVPSVPSREKVQHLQTLGGRLVFFAPSSRRWDLQLWVSDGTARGAHPVTDLPRDTYLQGPPVAQAGKLYFLVGRPGELEDVQTLWASDGTRRGTRVLTNAPWSRLYIEHLMFTRGMGNLLFFEAERRGYGREPWVTDGTPAGTRMLRDVCPGLCTSYTNFLEVFDGRLYFTASSADALEIAGLWSTDGTLAGTFLVSELCPDDHCTHDPPRAAFVVGRRLVFVERADEFDMEVWSTDGREAVQLTDFEPEFPWSEEGVQGAVLNGQLFFNADDGEHGFELWRTDGTRAGTEPVADLNLIVLGESSFPRSPMSLGSLAFFFTGPDQMPVLWKSDGTEAGTVPVKAFGPGALHGSQPAPNQFAEAGGVLVYFAYGYSVAGFGVAVWRTDGTEAGTFPLTGISAHLSESPVEMEALGSAAFFTFKGDRGIELWATDGTRAGTRVVLEDPPGEPLHLTAHAGRLWFFTDRGGRLWSTDGTAAALEADFGPELEATALVSLGDRLVFSFEDQGLWVMDGTGTRKISDREIRAYSFSSTQTRAVLQGRLFYNSTNGLHVTDGTEAGTEQLVDRDGSSIGAASMAALDDRVVFVAREVLWESDGTQAGTFPIDPEVVLSYPPWLVRAGDRVFFQGFEPLTGWELWAVQP